ncbi:hypothetical protein [Paraburkholderia sp.]|uniref:hypothetical protein n=1 Tax=Paraburkholderia sp. TaxID=1926495 RepID=UPI0039E2DE0F
MTNKAPNYATLAAQYAAMQWLRRHPLSDTRRIALYAALIEHMDIECVCYPGTRRLAAITRISRPVVLKLLKEFERCSLLEFLDRPTSGSTPRRVRLHFECLALVNPALTTNESDDETFVVNHALTISPQFAVNPRLTTQKPFVVNPASICGQPCVDPNSKQEYAGNSNESAPDAPKKSDVPRKADSRSNVAVKKKALVDRERLTNAKSARARQI